ncbi:MAG: lysyl oxidase family protein [Candidatus Campbellbacteria bacterium]|nr:lysyl oxidase family protein [Candidatus Campbellbacteria bacterium]
METERRERFVLFTILGAIALALVFFSTDVTRSVSTTSTTDESQTNTEVKNIEIVETEKEKAPPEKTKETPEKLPDIVALNPSELALEKREGEALLVFSSSYWNQGPGVLELVGIEKIDSKEDNEEVWQVDQRIYRKDGGYSDKKVGAFKWHASHEHFHYDSFALYTITSLDDPDITLEKEKAGFCARDRDTHNLMLEEAPDNSTYFYCEEELQGVSVGWGDTYDYTIPGQEINVDDLPSGRYIIRVEYNPDNELSEVSYENNISTKEFILDKENGYISVVNSE